MAAEARRLGLAFSSKDPFHLLQTPFALIRRSRRTFREIDNVLWGHWGDLEVRVFDYAYQETEDEWRRFTGAYPRLRQAKAVRTRRTMASNGGIGRAKPYQNAASTGSNPNCSRAPERLPAHSSQAAHPWANASSNDAPSNATNVPREKLK
jgi:hypothetical protein